jgi:hypothetical protein
MTIPDAERRGRRDGERRPGALGPASRLRRRYADAPAGAPRYAPSAPAEARRRFPPASQSALPAAFFLGELTRMIINRVPGTFIDVRGAPSDIDHAGRWEIGRDYYERSVAGILFRHPEVFGAEFLSVFDPRRTCREGRSGGALPFSLGRQPDPINLRFRKRTRHQTGRSVPLRQARRGLRTRSAFHPHDFTQTHINKCPTARAGR